jgi:hypothetical protein
MYFGVLLKSMKKQPWTQRAQNQPAGKGRYAIVKGKAYPSLREGRHPTGEVHSLPDEPSKYYYEDAVQLSYGDMDDIEGVDGIPLCYEHRPHDVVGKVSHSWVETAQGECLNLWAHIPLEDDMGRRIERGHEVLAEIRAGKIKGLSVGYAAPPKWDPITQTKKVSSKTFREISLVEEPFFNGCDLTVGVLAGGAGNLRNKITFLHN